MVSDNATTYLAAAEEITKLLNSREIREYMNNHRVEWIFIPKRAPWFGGFWERLIGLTKTALKKVLGHARVTLDELTTVVAEVEATLNDRPITYVDECDPLTPSLLLHGRLINTLPHELVDDDELTDPTYITSKQTTLEKRVKYLAKLHEHFWQRWSAEYLPALRERHSPKGKTGNVIKKGDVVLVQNDDKRRINWNLAVVQELRYGKDGLVRSASVKTKSGHTNRPISKLYPLEITCNDPNSTCGVTASDSDPGNQITTESASNDRRSIRNAAVTAQNKIRRWAELLRK
ncbi:uncharacterized protein [Ptychodera flava]|uniref:uncharacterized protein n=1 Tax=Ptychodera flava TaxID=63121 RepID=UPI00396A4ADD